MTTDVSESAASDASAPRADGPPPRQDGGGGRADGGPPRRGGGGGRGRFGQRRKVCAFCVDKVEHIDYKDPLKLRRYISDRGKIEPRRKTGTCARHQRRLTTSIKRARHLALLPYTADHIRSTNIFPPRAPMGRDRGEFRDRGESRDRPEFRDRAE